MMLNKPKHIKEPHRVGKPSESQKFKNNLNKKLNNSAYESIRNIIEEGDNTVAQAQLEKQNTNNLKAIKNIVIIKNLNKVYNYGFGISRVPRQHDK